MARHNMTLPIHVPQLIRSCIRALKNFASNIKRLAHKLLYRKPVK